MLNGLNFNKKKSDALFDVTELAVWKVGDIKMQDMHGRVFYGKTYDNHAQCINNYCLMWN